MRPARERSKPTKSAVLAISLFLAGCNSTNASDTSEYEPVGTHQWSDIVSVVDTLPLEENPGVITVLPHAFFRGDGSILVADSEEDQLREYSPSGDLLQTWSGKGSPGYQLRSPVAVLPLPSGEVFAVERSGVASVWNGGSDSLLLRRSLGPLQVKDAILVNDSTIWVSSYPRPLRGTNRLPGQIHSLHIPDLHVTSSFFSPAVDSTEMVAAAAAGWVDLTVTEETVLATFSMRNRVYEFDAQGTLLDSVTVETPNYRPPRNPRGEIGDRMTRVEWLGSFSVVSHVVPLDDILLVQYIDFLNSQPFWRLAGIDREGNTLFDVIDGPRLMGRIPESDMLVFMAGNESDPNIWVLAKLRL
jgi:hypothetical protein